ncbi:MAG: DNA repair protein RadA [Actinomycetota bacterium]
MARAKTVYECTTCGEQTPKWMGRCNGCGHWNTLVESVIGGDAPTATSATPAPTVGHQPAVPLAELDERACVPLPTGIEEFDRVLGGGLVVGSITLVGGEPGVGKSTLLSQVTAAWAGRHGPVLSVSAEESPQQVSGRFRRLGLGGDGVHVGGDCNINGVLADLAALQPKLAIVDSIQTVFDPELSSAPGSVAQVRQCSHRLAVAAREHNCAIVLVGQVTKDGGLAGPRVLEHLVDTVLSFDGEREAGLRVLRALKHRFGPTGELGVFEMTGGGLVTVEDPSGRMLGDRMTDVAGSAVAVTIEGRRAVVLETQGLVVTTSAPNPRRSTQGFDQKRLAMLLAVLGKQTKVPLAGSDVYLSVVGGMRINEPGADVAACAAIISSGVDRALPADVVAIGEVGLAGELRSASAVERRLQEAARLGFRKAIVPQSDAGIDADLEVVGATNIVAALDAMGLEVSAFTAPPTDHQHGHAERRQRADRERRLDQAKRSVDRRFSEFSDLMLDQGDGSAVGQIPDSWGNDDWDRPPIRLVPDDSF